MIAFFSCLWLPKSSRNEYIKNSKKKRPQIKIDTHKILYKENVIYISSGDNLTTKKQVVI